MDLTEILTLNRGKTITISGVQGEVSVLDADRINLQNLPALTLADIGTAGLLFESRLHVRRTVKEWLDRHPNTWYYMTLAAGCMLAVGGVVVACAGAIPIGIAMISSATTIIVHILPVHGQQLTMVPHDVATAMITRTPKNKAVTVSVNDNGRIDTFQVKTRQVTYVNADGQLVEDPGYIIN